MTGEGHGTHDCTPRAPSRETLHRAVRSPTAVSVDRSAPQELAELKGCRAFVIKVSVVGGLRRAAQLCLLAKSLGAKAVLSSAFEAGVGLAHASVLAAVYTDDGAVAMEGERDTQGVHPLPLPPFLPLFRPSLRICFPHLFSVFSSPCFFISYSFIFLSPSYVLSTDRLRTLWRRWDRRAIVL